jgi:predicted enzyme related to lactoylglutathione lyase
MPLALDQYSRIVWHDLMTVDLEKSKQFYEALFGWTTFEQDMGPKGIYTVIQHGGQPIGGMVATDPRHGVLTHWLPYLTVGDVNGLCQRIGKLDGSVAVEPRGVVGTGSFAILQDPSGSVFSAIEVGDGMPGAARSLEPGNFAWDQLLTRDSDAMARFYAEVCGWSVDKHEMGELGYYGIFKIGDEAVAGMLPIARDDKRKPGWLTYIAVDDIDEAAKKSQDLGAEILAGPDTVQGIVQFAVLRDNTDGAFGLFTKAD